MLFGKTEAFHLQLICCMLGERRGFRNRGQTSPTGSQNKTIHSLPK
jgi:hypothetical protein